MLFIYLFYILHIAPNYARSRNQSAGLMKFIRGALVTEPIQFVGYIMTENITWQYEEIVNIYGGNPLPESSTNTAFPKNATIKKITRTTSLYYVADQCPRHLD